MSQKPPRVHVYDAWAVAGEDGNGFVEHCGKILFVHPAKDPSYHDSRLVRVKVVVTEILPVEKRVAIGPVRGFSDLPDMSYVDISDLSPDGPPSRFKVSNPELAASAYVEKRCVEVYTVDGGPQAIRLISRDK